MVPSKKLVHTLRQREVAAQLLPELGTNDAVDEEVGRGVDNQEDVRYEATENTPDREPTKRCVPAGLNIIEYEDLVHVEEELEEITDDKCSHNHDEYEGKMILVSSLILSLFDRHVDLDIHDRNDDERKDSNNYETKPAMIVCYIEMIGSQLCNIIENSSISILSHSDLKELWQVETDREEGDWNEILKNAHAMSSLVVTQLMIEDWLEDCNIALSCNSNSHEDRASHGHGVERV